jgi:mono/diheme cytochrome c family protein
MHTVLTRLVPLALGLFVVTACGGGGAAPGDDEPTATSAAATTAGGRLDMDAIFPAGPGRELLLNNCQNCHTFVPIVVLQMDKDAWYRNSLDHRERVTTLNDEEFKTLYEYLAANFNPDRPVPELPKELLESWTGY